LSDFYNEKIIKARKKHKCYHCRNIIEIGEEYIKIASVYQGDFSTYKSHKLCQDLLEKVLDLDNEYEYDCDTARYGLEDYMCNNCDKKINCDKDILFMCGAEWIKKFNDAKS